MYSEKVKFSHANGGAEQHFSNVQTTKRRFRSAFSKMQFGPKAILFFTGICIAWEAYVGLYTQMSMRELNFWVWAPALSLQLFMLVTVLNAKRSMKDRACPYKLVVSALVLHALGDFSMREYEETHKTVFFFFAAIICFLVLTIFLMQAIKFDNYRNTYGLIQLFLVTMLTMFGGDTVLSGQASQSLPSTVLTPIVLCSIVYKFLWSYTLLKMYCARTLQMKKRKNQFLPKGKRKWHGIIINIGEEQKYRDRWNQIWTKSIDGFIERDHSVARVHIDPFMRQHTNLAFSGVYALRIAPTSERKYFQEALRLSELKQIFPSDSGNFQVPASLVVGLNERDGITAVRVDVLEGTLISDEQEYYFRTTDGRLHEFLKRKCRPNVIHAIAIAPQAEKTPFIRPPAPDLSGGGVFTLDIFRNYQAQDCTYRDPKILREEYYAVLKKLNTKVRCRSLTKSISNIAREESSSFPWNIVHSGEAPNFKKLLFLDWCQADELTKLQRKFFSGNWPRNARIFVDSLDFSKESRIIDFNGKEYRLNDLYGEETVYPVDGLRLEYTSSV